MIGIEVDAGSGGDMRLLQHLLANSKLSAVKSETSA